MTPEEVKQQAIAILQDILQFYNPVFADGIMDEFEIRMKNLELTYTPDRKE